MTKRDVRVELSQDHLTLRVTAKKPVGYDEIWDEVGLIV